MSVQKKFECMLFDPDVNCSYTVSGDEGTVVEEAMRHEMEEHGIDDTPENKQKIEDSLIDIAAP